MRSFIGFIAIRGRAALLSLLADCSILTALTIIILYSGFRVKCAVEHQRELYIMSKCQRSYDPALRSH